MPFFKKNKFKVNKNNNTFSSTPHSSNSLSSSPENKVKSSTLLPTEEIIKISKEGGADFGTGKASERIRYFIKLGLLPHTVRKQPALPAGRPSTIYHLPSNPIGLPAKAKAPVGHLPYWCVERLIKISSLAKEGLTFPQIAQKIKKETQPGQLPQFEQETPRPITPDTLLPTKEIVEIAKKGGADFGSGTADERIRYFIKLGLLPYAVRKLPSTIYRLPPNLIGHLPFSAVERLIKITSLNKSGLSFPQIAQKLQEEAQNTQNEPSALFAQTTPKPASKEDQPQIVKVSLLNYPQSKDIEKTLKQHEDRLANLIDKKLNNQTQIAVSYGKQENLAKINQLKTVKFIAIAAIIFSLISGTVFMGYTRYKSNNAEKSKLGQIAGDFAASGQVLAASSANHKLYIDADSEFSGTTLFKENITAPNIIYSVRAGTGIAVSSGQNPTVSLDTTAIVPSINDASGPITLKGSGSTSITNSGGTFTISSSSSGLTSEADTLSTVTGRGATTSTATSFTAGATVGTSLTLSAFSSNGGVLFTNASGVVQQVTAGTASQCLLGGTTPAFGSCSSGGVASLDGLTGALTISNSSGLGTTITIDDATTAAKGIASFSSSYFSVASGAVSIKTGGVSSTEILDATIAGGDLASNITISTTGNISTTGTGTITSAGLLTGSAGSSFSGGNNTFTLGAGNYVQINGTAPSTTTAGVLDINVDTATSNNRGVDLSYSFDAAGTAETGYGLFGSISRDTSTVAFNNTLYGQYLTLIDTITGSAGTNIGQATVVTIDGATSSQRAVYGNYISSTLTGATSSNQDNFGIYSLATSDTGGIDQTAYGIYAEGKNGDFNYGIYTTASGGTTSYGIYVGGGNTYVGSTLYGASLADCDTASTSKLLWSDTGVFSCGTDSGSGTLFSIITDTAGANTITNGDTLGVYGSSTDGLDGIDVTHTGDDITISFDATEIQTETWGAGSAVTWTFDAGATDPTLAFASDSTTLTSGTFALTGAQTISSTLGVTGIATLAANLNANGGLDVDDVFVVADGGAVTANTDVDFTLASAENFTLTVTTPTVDAVSAGLGTSSTDGVDGLALTFGVSAASGDLVHLVPSYTSTTTETFNVIEADAFTATQNGAATTGSVSGLKFGNLTQTETAGTITAYALNIGTGWDDVLNVGGTTVVDGDGTVIAGQITGTLFSTNTDSASANAVARGDTLGVYGSSTDGLDGIDVTHTGDDITISFDATEIQTETWGAGSAVTWTFDAGATDPTLAFASSSLTIGSAATIVSDQATLALFNATTTTLNFAGAATTALNIGNDTGNYTAINIGSGTGTHTINIAGTGATAADTINIGTGGTGADTINIGSGASSTALNLTSGTGSQTFTSSVATGTTTTSAFVFTDTALTSGTGIYANFSGSLTGSKGIDLKVTSTLSGDGIQYATSSNVTNTQAITGTNTVISLFGVYGSAIKSGADYDTSPSGINNIVGVYGFGKDTSTEAGVSPKKLNTIGGQFDANGTTAGNNSYAYGVYATASGGDFNYSGYFANAAGGAVYVDGSTNASTTTAGVLDIVTSSLTDGNIGLNLVYTSTAVGVDTTITQHGIYNNFTSDQAIMATSPTFNLYGQYNNIVKSNEDILTTAGTENVFGIYTNAQNISTDGGPAAGTRTTYGGYFSATGAAAGTTTAYGIFATAGSAGTNYGLYVNQGNSVFNGSQDGSLASFATNANTLPAIRGTHSSVVANGYVYVLGGSNGTTAQSTVYYAKLNADGSTGAFSTNTNALPATRSTHSSVVANGYVYVIGGLSGATFQSTVYYAKLNADGSTGAFSTNTNALPEARGYHSSVVANGYVYVIGGTSNSATQSTVYYAKLNADGSTGAWSTNANALPAIRDSHSSVVANGYIYVLGGFNGTTYQSTVYYAQLNADGSTGAFSTNANALPALRGNHSSVAANGYVYVLGGYDGSTAQSTVYYAKLNADGTIGAFATNTNTLSAIRTIHSSVVANGYVYVLGGSNGTTYQSTVYYASTARVSVAANLDLLGLTAGQLTGASSDFSLGSAGGSIFAGNIFSGGNLEVTGNTELWSGLSVNNTFNNTGSLKLTALDEAGSLSNIFLTDTSTNANSGGTASALNIATTINTTGAGSKTINGINVASPTVTACTTGACTFQGINIGAISGAILGTGIKIGAITSTGAANYGIFTGNVSGATNNYGIYVAGADTYGLWVDSGVTRLDGDVILGGSTLTGPASLTLATTTTFATSLTTFNCTDCINADDLANTIDFVAAGETSLTFQTSALGSIVFNEPATSSGIITVSLDSSTNGQRAIGYTFTSTSASTGASAIVYGIYGQLTHDSTAANTAYGTRLNVIDQVDFANTNIGGQFVVSNIGNAAKTNFGTYGLVTSTSTTADSLYGGYFKTYGNSTAARTANYGAITYGQSIGTATGDTVYGLYGAALSTGALVNAGTRNAYGIYGMSTVSGAAATATSSNAYGGIFSAVGESANVTNGIAYGIYTAASGGDNNYSIATADLTATASNTSYQINLGTTTGAASATFGGINIGAISGAGTTSYGINIGANTSTATTNYGLSIGAVSGAGTTNYGIKIGAISGATNRYPLHIDNTQTLNGILQASVYVTGAINQGATKSYQDFFTDGTITVTADPGNSAFVNFGYRTAKTIQIASAVSDTAGQIGFSSQDTFKISGVDNGARTIAIGEGFRSSFLTSNTGSGTTALTLTNFKSFTHTAATIAASTTVSNLYGFYAENTAPAGTLTNQYGVYIGALSGGTNDYGIYLAGADTSIIYGTQTSSVTGNIGVNLNYTSTATGNVTQYGMYNAFTNAQVLADDNTSTYYGNYTTVSKTGTDTAATTATTTNLFGTVSIASNTSGTDDAQITRNTYGGYFSAAGNTNSAGNAYGVYVTTGGSTHDLEYPLYISAAINGSATLSAGIYMNLSGIGGTTTTQYGQYSTITQSSTAGSGFSYGNYIDFTDAQALANVHSGYRINMALSGNAAKIAFGYHGEVSSSSTTADSLYGGYFKTTNTGAAARTTNYGVIAYGQTSSSTGDTVYGMYGATVNTGTINGTTKTLVGTYGIATATGATNNASTISNVYGGIFNAVGENVGATHVGNSYGIYASASGGDNNYPFYMGTAPVSSGTAALCWDASGDSPINDCSGAPVQDYAEIYPTASDVDYGDVLVLGSQDTETFYKKTDTNGNVLAPESKYIKKLVKSTTPYDSRVIGIASQNYADFTSTGHDSVKPEDHPLPVALSGRVPVKVSTENGSINPGDPLTTSSTAGVAMKADMAKGSIIGKALGSYSGEGIGEVMMFVETSTRYNLAQALQNTDLIANSFSTTSNSFNVDALGNVNSKSLTTSDGLLTIDGSGNITTSGNVVAGGTLSTANGLFTVDDLGNLASNTLTSNQLNITGDATVSGNLTTSAILTSNIQALTASDLNISLGDSAGSNSLKLLDSIGNLILQIDSLGNADFAGTVRADAFVTHSTADLAEAFPTSDNSVEAADIVAVDQDNKEHIKLSNRTYDPTILGVISTEPGFTLNANQLDARFLALAGRVPTKVNLENGPISAGDPITSSSTPGIGMKATQAGRVIGIALESFDTFDTCDTCDTFRTIVVFVNPSWYTGTSLAANGSIISQSQESASQSPNSALSSLTLTNAANPDGTLTSNKRQATSDTLSEAQIKELVSNEVKRQVGELLASSQQPAISSQQITAPVPTPQVAGSSDRSLNCHPKLDSGSPNPVIASEATQSTQTATSSLNSTRNDACLEASTAASIMEGAQIASDTQKSLDTMNNLLSTMNLKLDTLTLTGQANLASTQVAGTFSQDGTFIIDYGRQINVLGSTLFLQNDVFAGDCSLSTDHCTLIDIGAGSVTIDKNGDIRTQGTITAQNIQTKEITIDTSDVNAKTVGSANIASGKQSITIFTTALKPNAKVLLTPTGPTGGKTLYVANKSEYEGFTVALDGGKTANTIEFDWLIVNTSLQSKL